MARGRRAGAEWLAAGGEHGASTCEVIIGVEARYRELIAPAIKEARLDQSAVWTRIAWKICCSLGTLRIAGSRHPPQPAC